MKYKITTLKNKYALDDIINQSVESDIINATMELLDKIFESASDAYNPNRLYVKIVYDENIEDNNSSGKIISGTKIMPLLFKTRQENGVNVIDSINCDITYIKESPIYLAVLYQYQKESFIRLRSSTLETNEFDVVQNKKIIGKYQCVDSKDKNAHYFHFKKFEYKAIE